MVYKFEELYIVGFIHMMKTSLTFAFYFIFPLYDVWFFFGREFQPMASTSDDSSLLLDQDTNKFFV